MDASSGAISTIPKNTLPFAGGLGGGGWGLDWESAPPDIQLKLVKELFDPLSGSQIYERAQADIAEILAAKNRTRQPQSLSTTSSTSFTGMAASVSTDQGLSASRANIDSRNVRLPLVDYATNPRFLALVTSIIQKDLQQVVLILDEDARLRGDAKFGKGGKTGKLRGPPGAGTGAGAGANAGTSTGLPTVANAGVASVSLVTSGDTMQSTSGTGSLHRPQSSAIIRGSSSNSRSTSAVAARHGNVDEDEDEEAFDSFTPSFSSLSVPTSATSPPGLDKDAEAQLDPLVDMFDASGYGALHVAATVPGGDAILRVLIQRGANVGMKTLAKRTSPLHCASWAGIFGTVQALIAQGGDVNSRSSRLSTALHGACLSGSAECVEALLKARADISSIDVDRRSALHYAAMSGNPAVVALLKKDRGVASVMQGVDALGFLPIHYAAMFGRTALLEPLLSPVISVDVENLRGRTPLILAAKSAKVDTMKTLLEMKANIDKVERVFGHSPLHTCLVYPTNPLEHLDVVTFLIEAKANPSCTDFAGRTPLHFAAASGSLSVVGLLLELGVTVDARALDKSTPLKHAAHAGALKVVELLIEHRASPIRVDVKGCGPLHMAAAQDHSEVFARLLGFSSYVDALEDLPKHAALAAATAADQQTPTSPLGPGGGSRLGMGGAGGTNVGKDGLDKGRYSKDKRLSLASSGASSGSANGKDSDMALPQLLPQKSIVGGGTSGAGSKIASGALADRRTSMVPLSMLLEVPTAKGLTPLHFAAFDSQLYNEVSVADAANAAAANIATVASGDTMQAQGHASELGEYAKLLIPTRGIHQVARGSVAIVKLLLAAGVDVTRVDHKGRPALNPFTPKKSLKLLAKHYIKKGIKPLPLCAHTFFWREVGFQVPPRDIDKALIDEVTPPLLFEAFQRAWARPNPLPIQSACAFFSLPTVALRPLLCESVLHLATKHRDLRLFAAIASAPPLDFLHSDPASAPLLLALYPALPAPSLDLKALMNQTGDASSSSSLLSSSSSSSSSSSPSSSSSSSAASSLGSTLIGSSGPTTAAGHALSLQANTLFTPAPSSGRASGAAGASAGSKDLFANSDMDPVAASRQGFGGGRHGGGGRGAIPSPPWIAALQLICYGPLRLRRLGVPLVHAPEFLASNSAAPPGLEEFLGLHLPVTFEDATSEVSRNAQPNPVPPNESAHSAHSAHSTSSASPSSGATSSTSASAAPAPIVAPVTAFSFFTTPTADLTGPLSHPSSAPSAPASSSSSASTSTSAPLTHGVIAATYSASVLAKRTASTPWTGVLPALPPPSTMVLVVDPSRNAQIKSLRNVDSLAPITVLLREWTRWIRLAEINNSYGTSMPAGPKQLALVKKELGPLFPASQVWIMSVCALLDAGADIEREDVAELFTLGFPLPHYRRLRSFVETLQLGPRALRLYSPLFDVLVGRPPPAELPSSSVLSNAPSSLFAKAREAARAALNDAVGGRGSAATAIAGGNGGGGAGGNRSARDQSGSDLVLEVVKPSSFPLSPATARAAWVRRWCLYFCPRLVTHTAQSIARSIRQRKEVIKKAGLDLSFQTTTTLTGPALKRGQSSLSSGSKLTSAPSASHISISTSTSTSTSTAGTGPQALKNTGGVSISRPASSMRPISKYESPLYFGREPDAGELRDSEHEQGEPLNPPPEPPRPPSPDANRRIFIDAIPDPDDFDALRRVEVRVGSQSGPGSANDAAQTKQSGAKSRSIFATSKGSVLTGTINPKKAGQARGSSGGAEANIAAAAAAANKASSSADRRGAQGVQAGAGADLFEMELHELPLRVSTPVRGVSASAVESKEAAPRSGQLAGSPQRSSSSSAASDVIASASASNSSSSTSSALQIFFPTTGSHVSPAVRNFFTPTHHMLETPVQPLHNPRDPLQGWDDMGLRVQSFGPNEPLPMLDENALETKEEAIRVAAPREPGDGKGRRPNSSADSSSVATVTVGPLTERELGRALPLYWQRHGRSLKPGPNMGWERPCDVIYVPGQAYGPSMPDKRGFDDEQDLVGEGPEVVDWGTVATVEEEEEEAPNPLSSPTSVRGRRGSVSQGDTSILGSAATAGAGAGDHVTSACATGYHIVTEEARISAKTLAETIPMGPRDQTLLHICCLNQRPRAAAAVLCLTLLMSAPMDKKKTSGGIDGGTPNPHIDGQKNKDSATQGSPPALLRMDTLPQPSTEEAKTAARHAKDKERAKLGPRAHPQDIPALFAQDLFGLTPVDYCTDPLSLLTVRAWASVLALTADTADVSLFLRTPNLLQSTMGVVDSKALKEEALERTQDMDVATTVAPDDAASSSGCCGGGSSKKTASSPPPAKTGAPGSSSDHVDSGAPMPVTGLTTLVVDPSANAGHFANRDSVKRNDNLTSSPFESASSSAFFSSSTSSTAVKKSKKNRLIHSDQRVAELFATKDPDMKDTLPKCRIPLNQLLSQIESLGLAAHRVRKRALGLDAVLVAAPYGRLLLEAQSFSRTEPSMRNYLRTELSAAAASVSAAAIALDDARENNVVIMPQMDRLEDYVKVLAERNEAARSQANAALQASKSSNDITSTSSVAPLPQATVSSSSSSSTTSSSSSSQGSSSRQGSTTSKDDEDLGANDMSDDDNDNDAGGSSPKRSSSSQGQSPNVSGANGSSSSSVKKTNVAPAGAVAGKDAEKRRTAELAASGKAESLVQSASSPGLQRWGFFKLLWDNNGAFMRPPPVLSSSHRLLITDRILSGTSEIRLLLPPLSVEEQRREDEYVRRCMRLLREDPLEIAIRYMRREGGAAIEPELELWASCRPWMKNEDVVDDWMNWAMSFPVATGLHRSQWFGDWASPLNCLEWAEDGRIESIIWPHAPEEVEVLVDAWGNDYIPEYVRSDVYVSMYAAPPDASQLTSPSTATLEQEAAVAAPDGLMEDDPDSDDDAPPSIGTADGASDGKRARSHSGSGASFGAGGPPVANVGERSATSPTTGAIYGDPLEVVKRRRETQKGWCGSSYAARMAAPIFNRTTFWFMFKETPNVDKVPASYRYTRLYAGEQATFYFVFTTFIMHYLIPVILSGAVFTYFHFTNGVDNSATPWNSLLLSLWSTWLIEMWSRKQSELAMHWDRRQFKNLERISLRFKPLLKPDGSPVTVLNNVTGEQEPYYPAIRRRIKVAISIIFTLAMMGVVFIVHVSVLAIDKPTQEVQYALSIGSAVMIQVTKAIYLYMAEVLTEWENYKLESQAMTSLNLKSFSFCFFNEFFSLYWIALGQDDSGEPAAERLFIQIVTLVGTSIVTNLLLQQLVPWLQFRSATRTRTCCLCCVTESRSFLGTLQEFMAQEEVSCPLYDLPKGHGFGGNGARPNAGLASGVLGSSKSSSSSDSAHKQVPVGRTLAAHPHLLPNGKESQADMETTMYEIQRQEQQQQLRKTGTDDAAASPHAEVGGEVAAVARGRDRGAGRRGPHSGRDDDEGEDPFMEKMWRYTQNGLNQVTGRRSARMIPLSNSAKKERLVSASMVELLRPPATRLFSDYLTIMILLGYVVGFAAIFPEGPMLILIAVWLERQGDLTRYLTVSRRSLPQPAGNVGAWSFALSFLSYSSIVSNGVLLFYTTDNSPNFNHLEPRFLFVCYLLILGTVKSGISRFIVDAARWVSWTEERADLKALADERKYGHMTREQAVKEVAELREKVNTLKRALANVPVN